MSGAPRFLPRLVTAGLCTALHLCLGTIYAWSLFQTFLVRQLGWTFTETAWAFSIAIFSLGISAAWAGAALPRLGPRRLALAGSVMFSGGYLIAGLALHLDSKTLFHLGYGVIGGAGIGLGYVTPVATVAKWFPDRKGLATGAVVMGFGVGALLLSKVLVPILMLQAQGDLPLVFLLLGVVFACILIPASALLRDPPPGYFAGTGLAGRNGAGPEPPAPPLRACLRSREFVVMWIVFFFNIAAGISVISFQSSLLQDVWGLSDPSVEPETLAEYGATLIAVSSLCNGVGRLLWGSLSDRIGRVRVFRILLASQMVVFRHPDNGARPLAVLRARVLCAALFRRRLRHHAVLRPRRLRRAADVHGLWRGADRLVRGGDLRTPLRGVSQGRVPRPGGDLLFPHRHPDPGRGVRVHLVAERRPPPRRPPDPRKHLARAGRFAGAARRPVAGAPLRAGNPRAGRRNGRQPAGRPDASSCARRAAPRPGPV